MRARRSLVSVFLVVLLIGSGVSFWRYLGDYDRFGIKLVQIRTKGAYIDRVRLQHVVGRGLNRSFFALDVETIRAAVLRLPWVETVAVRRVWPDRLVITLTQHQPLAIWNENQLVSQQGVVFSPRRDTYPAGLVKLTGPSERIGLIVTDYVNMQKALDRIRQRIVELSLAKRGAWEVTLGNGMQLELGSEQVMKRLAYFIEAYPVIVQHSHKQAKVVDLRYPNGFAISWIS